MAAAPIIFRQIAATLLANIAGAFLFFRLRSALSQPKQNALHLLFPRFVLLEALSDQIHKLPSLVPPDQWYPFVSHFTSTLNKIVENDSNTNDSNVSIDELFDESTIEDQGVNPADVAKLSEAIDRHLVAYLQSIPELASLVEGYLPRPGQTWMEFLTAALDRQELELAVSTNSQAQLMKACIQLAKGMVVRIKGYRLQDTRRGTVNIHELPPPTGYKVEKVFYATDRQVTEDCEYLGSRRKIASYVLDEEGDGEDGNDTEFSELGTATSSSETPHTNINPLHYGKVLVGVPSEHHKGKLEAPEHNQEASPLSHVVILAIDTSIQSSDQGFAQMVRSDMLENEKLAGDGKKEILVYIHGYNVRFKEAVKRAAQVKYDVQFQGALICYSWASKGRLFGYKHDAKTVKLTVDSLAKFLHLCFTKLGATKLHILAHSMGNRALIAALEKVLAEAKTAAPLRNAILAAADEERRYFEKLVKTAAKHKQGPRFTVYCSSADLALRASRAVNWRVALGDTRSYLQLDEEQGSLLHQNNVDTVDATGLDLNTLHHSYYGDVPEVLHDIQQLLELDGAKERGGHRNPGGLIKLVNYKVFGH